MTDDGIDPHLRAALRHAPDHERRPPASVDQHIKAAARQALTPQPAAQTRSRPDAAPQSWRRWFDRLLQPPAAAAFATLALGTVIALMWQDQRPGPVAEPPAIPAPAAVPPPAPPAPPATAGTPATAATPATPPMPAAPATRPAPMPAREAAAPRPRATPAPSKSTSVADPVAVAEAAHAATPPDTQVQAEPSRKRAETDAVVAAAPPHAAAPVTAPAALPAPAAASPQPPAAVVQRNDAAPATSADTQRASARAMPGSGGPPARAGAPAPAAAPAVAPQAALGATLFPIPPPSSIAALGLATSGPWQRVPSSPMPEGGQLVRDQEGQVLGRLLAQGQWLWWQPWVNGQPALPVQRALLRSAASAPAR